MTTGRGFGERGFWLAGLLGLVLVLGAAPGCDTAVFDDRTGDPDLGAPLCNKGDTRCEGNVVMECSDKGGTLAWVQKTLCTTAVEICKTSGGTASCVNLPSCTDNKQNRDETDVDCGGASCAACPSGKGCKKDTDCQTGACVAGTCRVCKANSYSCLGNLLRICKGDNSGWNEVATCDPTKYEACDVDQQQCVKLAPKGSAKPTGTYFLFGFFEKGQTDFKGGYDVDGYGDLLYVNNSRKLDVYRVTLQDSDGDGKLEPNQHPDNKDNRGPVEKRTLTYVKTHSNVTLGNPSVGEIFAEKDRIYFLKEDGSVTSLYEFEFATGKTTLKIKGQVKLCCAGFDEQARQWFFAHNSSNRVVYAYWPNGKGIAAEFWYPDLAGSHLDGIEVVTDPKTKRSYVYVSDMTSDFLAQYYLDRRTDRWVQKNVFEYKETQNQHVEGMGFGAFQHFWATSGKALYEVGGGDLQKYVGIK